VLPDAFFSWLFLSSSSLLPYLLSILLVLLPLTGGASGSQRLSLLRSTLALRQSRCAIRGLKQRQHDLEARTVFARMGSPRMVEEIQEQARAQDLLASSAQLVHIQEPSSRTGTTNGDETRDDDDEELEEYEEYR
jgi:hypothetical protein